ncbi:MAG: MarR family transcriptional regulator [Spirochaetes bacterium GWD1_61_31]|nr:MAG: MarR family transcriptional regulator [Spirochaetes bacterium GWB1_60_80]OHD31910.1 MAG: MarR family transcriptional regulator [Spirochaetes bacterium GWC1_61_12]OHD39993.1 MAG: MarR family transcriptional regulator [Spirochaetes bacterium GWD1_61_31]OHD42353.1 MAG: MarR family transcriptional regulator [Spirochaetes bacterium GWE1_60_18]OHD60525.1 MAG: MarR family transcriptional regulator [Spirochaetes bacterium GWF1_60_12]
MSYPELLLSNQLCFLVHRLNRGITSRYRPLLAKLGLTYPQYLVLLALWERDGQGVGELCTALDLDTGTMSPLLKRLAAAGLLERRRRPEDERAVGISLTAAGRALEESARALPVEIAGCLLTGADEYVNLKRLLQELVGRLERVDC